jgi:type IV secretory pathway VirB10-like protein
MENKMTELEKNPAVIEVTDGIMALESFAANYQVATPSQYKAGAADLARVKGMQKKLEETRTGITGPMNAALKKVNDFFRAPGEKLAVIENTIKGKLGAYYEEQQRIQREEQRRADEAAATERRRAEAAAAEARRKAEEEAAALRRQAEEADAAGRAADAAKLAARADTKIEKAEAKAADLEQQAATVVAPVIHREPPRVAGLQMRDVWEFTIVDPKKINPEFMAPDEKKIGAQVKALKGDAAAIIGEGIKVTKRMVPASSAA